VKRLVGRASPPAILVRGAHPTLTLYDNIAPAPSPALETAEGGGSIFSNFVVTFIVTVRLE